MLAIPLGERIPILSVGNVELIFKNWFRLSMLWQKLIRGREDVKYSQEPKFSATFVYAWVLLCHFSGFSFHIK